MIDVMHLTALIFVISVSGTSSLDSAQTLEWDPPKGTKTRPRSRNLQSPLLGNVGAFQEVDATWQLLSLSGSGTAGVEPIEVEAFYTRFS
jgi:hypothetical protein